MHAMRKLLVLLPSTITMVVGFQSTKVPFLTNTGNRSTKPQLTTAVIEMSLKKKSSSDTDGTHFVDSLVHPWMEKSVQVVSTLVIGWTLATSMAMATDADLLLSPTTNTIDDASTMVLSVTGVSSESAQAQAVTESSPPSINEVAVDAMFLSAGMTFTYLRNLPVLTIRIFLVPPTLNLTSNFMLLFHRCHVI